MQNGDRSGDRLDRTAHWEGVYQRNDDPTRLTWFQPSPEESLRMIEAAVLDRDARIIDVGGGTSSLVDHLLDIDPPDPPDVVLVRLDELEVKIGDSPVAELFFEAYRVVTTTDRM